MRRDSERSAERMEPIDKRITAARLMSMRGEPNAEGEISGLLRVAAMPARLALRTVNDIRRFLATGDATLASQLIHTATVRRGPRSRQS